LWGTSETAQNVRRHRFVFRANGGDTEEAGLAWPGLSPRYV
jgi:hypothetical protein